MPNAQPPTRRHNPIPRRGFTLIEMLVVIGIILVLVGMSIAGFNQIARHSKAQHTKVALEAAKAMLTEFEAAGGKQTVSSFKSFWDNTKPKMAADATPSNPVVHLVVSPTVPVTGTPTLRDYSALVLEKLLELPANRAIYDKLPSEQTGSTLWTVTVPGPGGNVTRQCHEILDGYGHPLLFVPSAGITNVTAGSQAAASNMAYQSDGGFHNLNVTNGSAPNARYFWMSAGPDGNPQTGDDNHYSFEQ